MLILKPTSPELHQHRIRKQISYKSMHCINQSSGRYIQNENKETKETEKRIQTRYKNAKRKIHTWIKFFLKIKNKLHTTIFIIVSIYAEILDIIPLLFCHSSFSLKNRYNMRLLLSDSTQVQSGMLLVRNGICSKFHCIPQAALRIFLIPPSPGFFPPPTTCANS